MTEVLQATGVVAPQPKGRTAHPIRSLLISRLATGVLSVIVISIVVYAATLVYPGTPPPRSWDSGTPERLAQLRSQLHLDRSPVSEYISRAKAALHGDFGTSLLRASGCGT